FTGSLVAFAKLQGWLDRRVVFRGQREINLLILVAAVVCGGALTAGYLNLPLIAAFFALALRFGLAMTLPIGGADMPVVISLYNALTGLAVGLEGFVLGNPAMMIAGIVVGAAGFLLTQLMAKAMNRSLAKVLFKQFGAKPNDKEEEVEGDLKPIEANDAASLMAYAEKVIVVPGYGMAVAQAQHKIWEFCKLLQEKGVDVKFAIHPVAGRMPGHMNVLLAEAGVPYDMIYDLEEINEEFPAADVALVIGANDVVNPIARTDPDSPIYGMPILDADKAENVIVIKRGKGAGFSGVENHLFYAENTRMLYGDGQKMGSALIAGAKSM
ncbi:MAG: NAD(P)(+) transhydrogenase (Re/Si-specific) subunit beta, partial [Gammaproteobacteria bacterium]